MENDFKKNKPNSEFNAKNDKFGATNPITSASKKSFDETNDTQKAYNTTLTAKNANSAADKFIQDPEYVQSHVEFCDELVEKGYPLEEAIEKTDKCFKILSDKDTYN